MSKKFTAKVFLSHASSANGETTLEFSPDYTDDRNKEWAKYTPSLKFRMIVLDEVAEGLEYGDTATVTFDFDKKEE